MTSSTNLVFALLLPVPKRLWYSCKRGEQTVRKTYRQGTHRGLAPFSIESMQGQPFCFHHLPTCTRRLM